jgi:hypothetical protein
MLQSEQAVNLLSSLKDLVGPSHSFNSDPSAAAYSADGQNIQEQPHDGEPPAHNGPSAEFQRSHIIPPSAGAADCADDYTVVDYSEKIEGDDLSGIDPAFIELTSPSPDPSLRLNCKCKPHSCDCDKRCYCRIRTPPYVGARMSPPDIGSLSGMSPEHSCQCNLGEVGGNGFNPGNTIDCDCNIAKCKCSQKCVCPTEPGH